MARTPNQELTTAERAALEQYIKHQDKCGEPPSQAELAARLGCSRSNAAYLIGRLRDKGAIGGVSKRTFVRLRVTAKGRKLA